MKTPYAPSLASILALSSAGLLVLSIGCSKGTDELRDAGATDVASTDASPADSGPGNPDASLPDAEPLRRLVEQKLFGGMPIDNSVVNPYFDPSSQSWYGIGDLSTSEPRFVRATFRELAQTPLSQPVLLVRNGETDPLDTIVVGSVMAAESPLEASVWIGRNTADSSALITARPVLLMTLAASGEEQAFELIPDVATATITFGAIGWQRYSATINEQSTGIITITFQDPSHLPLYIHAPVVRGQVRTLRLGAPLVRPRGLTAVEVKASAMIAKERRRHLGALPKVEAPLSPEVLQRVLRGPSR